MRQLFSGGANDQSIESGLDPLASLFDDDFEPVATPVKGYEPPAASPEILELLERFEEQIEGIFEGTFPVWSKFFLTARKLESEYFCDYGQSTALSDELMSVYELQDVEALYSDQKFLREVVKILDEDVHFACFMLNSGNEDQISPKIMADIVNALLERKLAMDCEGCTMNQWWGNPIAYVSVHEHTSAADLKRIYTRVHKNDDEMARDVVLCTLAQNPNTPEEILKKLSAMDRDSLMARDEMCPFFDENDSRSINIAYWATRTLSNK
jgi:hypothetical protein